MREILVVVGLVFLINGICLGAVPDEHSSVHVSIFPENEKSACEDEGSLAKSLRVQRLDSEESAGYELLDSLGVKIVAQGQRFYFKNAIRISGNCVSYLDEVRLANYHFDTGVTLVLNDEGLFVPYTMEYRPRFVVESDDAHPEILRHHFVKAIEAGSGYGRIDLMKNFIGVWGRDDKTVVTPYKKVGPEEFRVYGDLIELEGGFVDISFFPGLHGVSGAIQILLRDGDDRVVMTFMWIYWKLFSDNVD